MKPFGIIMFVACLLATSVRADYWSGLQQTQRDQAILVEARKSPDGTWGGVDYLGNNLECKGWVKKVVANASKNLVILPVNNTDTNSYQFWSTSNSNKSTTPERVTSFYVPPQLFQPGYIVQMRLYCSDGTIVPHTFIVTSVTSTEIIIIECNRRYKSEPNTVYRNHMTFAEFLRQTKGYYTVYQTH
jgi:hypothetical protein